MTQNPGRGGASGEFARSSGFAAAKGAALIGVAVVIGVVLLQVVDDGSSGPVATAKNSGTTTSTSEPTSTQGTTTTSTAATAVRAKSDVAVLVLNGGGPAGAAKTMSDRLQAAGYVNQPVLPTDDDKKISGDEVMCRSGFDQEATQLAIAVGSDITKIVAFRSPPPPQSSRADCVVIVGSTVTPTT